MYVIHLIILLNILGVMIDNNNLYCIIWYKWMDSFMYVS
jgi:hypothetical protein